MKAVYTSAEIYGGPLDGKVIEAKPGRTLFVPAFYDNADLCHSYIRVDTYARENNRPPFALLTTKFVYHGIRPTPHDARKG